VRPKYQPFESDLRSATGEVYLNEIPGGQYSNFRPQAESLGVGDRWKELKETYAEVNKLFGGIIKVTPSSKVVGDFAIFMLSNDLTADDVIKRAGELNFPASAIEFFKGLLGEPYGGFPEELRKAILKGEPVVEGRPGESLPPADFEAAKQEATELLGRPAFHHHALSLVLYPAVFKAYAEARQEFGDCIIIPTLAYFYGLEEGEEIIVDLERGKRLFITLIAVSEPNEKGERTVFFALNGQPRNIIIRDNSVATSEEAHEKADAAVPGSVGAPLAGSVVSVEVKQGDTVSKQDKLFTIEAMKMQTIVHSPVDGRVERVVLDVGTRVDVGDLVVELS